jgi:hypothetical protein
MLPKTKSGIANSYTHIHVDTKEKKKEAKKEKKRSNNNSSSLYLSYTHYLSYGQGTL